MKLCLLQIYCLAIKLFGIEQLVSSLEFPLKIGADPGMVMDGIEPAVINHMLVKLLTWCRCEDTENIGMMELHVIPNVCSEYSEQSFR